jgi:uncharacterized repeat protein (TIGR01451 family)
MNPLSICSANIRKIAASRGALAVAGLVMVVCSVHAQSRPVRLSINNSSTVAFQANSGTGPNDLSMAYFAGNLVGQANRRLMQLRVADPVLCADFTVGQPDSTVRMRLVDSNQLIQGGDTRGFQGLSPLVSETGGIRLSLDPSDSNKRVLNIGTEASLKCSVFPNGALPPLQPVTEKREAAAGDLIFADGFETPVIPGTELVTTFIGTVEDPDLVPFPATARAGDAVIYRIRVKNIGAGTANNVQVRDFFNKPTTASVVPGFGTVIGTLNPGTLDGTWTCTGSTSAAGTASCSQPTGNGYVFESGATIPSQAELIFNISRVLSNATAPTTGAQFRFQAAAFSQPSENEVNRVNNAIASNLLTVVTNIPPTVGGLLTRIINEDTNTGDLAFTVTDPDNTGPLNVTAASTNLGLIGPSGIVLGGSGNNRTIRLTPNANAFGFSIINITVNDGISSTTTGFSLQVNAVNDAPSFTISSACPTALGMVFTPESGITPATMTFPVGVQDSYQCLNALLLDFGPGESGQSIAAITDLAVVRGGVLFGSTGNVQVNSGNAALSFTLSGASGIATISFRVQDNGGVANGGVDLSPLKTLRIRVPSAAPTMSTIAPQTGLEDVVLGPISFTVADSDTPLTALVVSRSSDNTALIDNTGIIFGGSGGARTFTLTPKSNQFGSANITVNVTDGDEIVSQTFVYTVNSVNDAPTFNVTNINLAANAALNQDVLVATAMSPGGGIDEQIQSLTWLPMQSHTPTGTGNLLNGVLPTIITNASPSTTANMNFDLRDAGAGLPPSGFICLKARLRDNGSPAGTTIKIVRIVVGTDTFPACDP